MGTSIELTGWRTALWEMLAGIRSAIDRFTVSSVFLFLAALNASLLVADVELYPDGAYGFVDQDSLVGAFLAGAIAAVSAVLFGETRAWPASRKLVVSLLAALLAFALIWPSSLTHTLEWTFLMALYGLVVVIPFLMRGTGASLWMFGAWLVFASVLAGLALLLFAGGISAILASLTHLFGIDIPSRLYQHVWIFTGLFVAPLFGLGQVPRDFTSEPGAHESDFMNRGMRALGDFAAVPLLILYALILHLYALKIVLTGEVPKGQIGWLVLTYGFCVFGVLILTRPFLDMARAPTRFFVRYWPFLLPMPLVLLFYALFLRVGMFGITPDRFLLGLFGLVAAILVISQLAPQLRGNIRLIAALPVVALLLGSFGPQGAVSVSLNSQAKRFLAFVKEQPVEGERHDDALSALRYLQGRDALGMVTPEPEEGKAATEQDFRAVAQAWGLNPDRPAARMRNGNFDFSRSEAYAFSSDGFDVVVKNAQLSLNGGEPLSLQLPGGGRLLTLAMKGDAIEIASGEKRIAFQAGSEIIRVINADDDQRAIEIALEAEGRKIKMIPTYLTVEKEPEPLVRHFTGMILLRSADWQ